MNRISWVFALVFLVSACATGSKSPSQTDRAGLYLNLAIASVNEGDLVTALNSLEQAEGMDPKNASVHLVRSLVFYMKKDLPRAEVSALKAYELNPKSSENVNNYGKILLDLGKSEEAAPLLRKAADDPKYGEAYKAKMSLGVLYYRQGDLKESEKYLVKAIEESPARACTAYYYRGQILQKRKEFDKALRDYDRATRDFCTPFAGEAHMAIAKVYIGAKDYNKARRKLLEVQKLYPEGPFSEQALEQLRYLP
jgi:Tfp pilus assembly protein PilF